MYGMQKKRRHERGIEQKRRTKNNIHTNTQRIAKANANKRIPLSATSSITMCRYIYRSAAYTKNKMESILYITKSNGNKTRGLGQFQFIF